MGHQGKQQCWNAQPRDWWFHMVSFIRPRKSDDLSLDVLFLYIVHRIGLWENLQESPIFDSKNHGFL